MLATGTAGEGLASHMGAGDDAVRHVVVALVLVMEAKVGEVN